MNIHELTPEQKHELMKSLMKDGDVKTIRKELAIEEKARLDKENKVKQDILYLIRDMSDETIAAIADVTHGYSSVKFPKDAETLTISVENGEITEFSMRGTFVEKAKLYGSIAPKIEEIVNHYFPNVPDIVAERVTAIEFEIQVSGRVKMLNLNFRGARRFSLEKYREEFSTGNANSVQGNAQLETVESDKVSLPEVKEPKVIGKYNPETETIEYYS